MSYTFDAKIANQSPRRVWNSGTPSCLCENCGTLVPFPETSTLIEGSAAKVFAVYSYIGKKEYIYETKSGTAVVYCSDYCRKRHNHRFNV